MKCHYAGETDTGKVRAANQDAYYIDPEGRFFIVADGMGGHAGGQEASQIAAKRIQTYLQKHWKSPDPSDKLLENAFLHANDGILADQEEHPERSDMGTTAVVILFRDPNQPWCANVGDSRLYRMRGKDLEQISQDQTWVAQAVASNLLTLEDARIHPWRHVLSQCLGRAEPIEVDLIPVDIQVGDRLLLCSDGLTEELTDEMITKVLTTQTEGEAAAEALIEAAKDKGGRDNITVVIVALAAEEDTL